MLFIKDKKMEKIIIGILLLLTVGCSPSGEKKEKEVRKYRNPILAYSVPDPTVIKAEDGMFYLYATEDIRNMPFLQKIPVPILNREGDYGHLISILLEGVMCYTIRCRSGAE